MMSPRNLDQHARIRCFDELVCNGELEQTGTRDVFKVTLR